MRFKGELKGELEIGLNKEKGKKETTKKRQYKEIDLERELKGAARVVTLK